MLAGYAVLDGFDLGIGALHLLLGRSREDREVALNAIGPVWNGNEVWLIAAGGSMVAAFPRLYATSFSGFYLALMLVLWLLILRGLGIEFRHQVDHPMWQQAWDVVFSVSSLLLALLFGVALGNVLRGVPFDASSEFQGTFTLLLNPFALLGGVLSVAVLSLHGAAYLTMKTVGELQARARSWVRRLWGAAVATVGGMVVASFVVRPDFTVNFTRWPLLLVLPGLTVVAVAMVRVYSSRRDDTRAFVASACFIAGMLGSVAAGLFPRLLPARPGSAGPDLDIYNSAAPPHSLAVALVIYVIGLALVVVYLVYAYRVWGGKVTREHAYHL